MRIEIECAPVGLDLQGRVLFPQARHGNGIGRLIIQLQGRVDSIEGTPSQYFALLLGRTAVKVDVDRLREPHVGPQVPRVELDRSLEGLDCQQLVLRRHAALQPEALEQGIVCRAIGRACKFVLRDRRESHRLQNAVGDRGARLTDTGGIPLERPRPAHAVPADIQ